MIVYQLGLLFTGGTQIVGLVIALALLALMLFQLFRPYKEAQTLTVE
jgi:ferrous iron transport protein B